MIKPTKIPNKIDSTAVTINGNLKNICRKIPMIIAIITAINVTVFSFEMFIHFHSLTITLYHAIAFQNIEICRYGY